MKYNFNLKYANDKFNIYKNSKDYSDKLITLNRNSTKIPIISDINDIIMTRNIPQTITPTTNYIGGTDTSATSETNYIITIADRRFFTELIGANGNVVSTNTYSDGTSVSAVATGPSFNLKPTNSLSLFGTNNQILTTATIEGLDTGAKTTISITINKA